MNKRYIYSLNCPITKDIHYIGKSTQGMMRPLQHLTKSHNEKIKEWVSDLKELGYTPEIRILEEVSLDSDIDARELFWIQKSINNKDLLLNINLVKPFMLDKDLDELLDPSKNTTIESISEFIKTRRKSVNLTQEEFAERSGVALTVVRKLEQGKPNVNLTGLMQILWMFGYSLEPKKLSK